MSRRGLNQWFLEIKSPLFVLPSIFVGHKKLEVLTSEVTYFMLLFIDSHDPCHDERSERAAQADY